MKARILSWRTALATLTALLLVGAAAVNQWPELAAFAFSEPACCEKHDPRAASSASTTEPTTTKLPALVDLLTLAAPLAEGWPQLFGPAHNSISGETNVNLAWPASGPPLLWKRSIGSGYTAPVARDGRLVLLHRIGDEEIAECLDAATGESVWQHRYPTAYKCRFEYSDGPASTPVFERDRVYTLGAEGELHCLAADTGAILWRRPLGKEFKLDEALFGFGGSPLVDGDRLILNLGAWREQAGMIALDKATGETLWTATDHRPSYATPRAATIHGRRFVFALTNDGLLSLDPASGQLHWQIPFRSRSPDSPNATSPLVEGDLVLVSAARGLGSVCVRVLPDGSYAEVWRDRRVLDSQWNNLVAVNGYIYGYASSRAAGENFRCVELATGKLKWKWSSPLERGSSLAVAGHLLLFGEHGHLGALQISPSAPHPVAMTAEPLLATPCYTLPILHQGRLYLRNETTLACYNLRP